MANNVNVVIGVCLIAGGLAVTALSYSAAANGGTYVVAWGAVAVGVVRLFRGLAAPAERGPMNNEEFEQSLGRTGESEGPQVVGRACAHCREKIVSVADGDICRQCQKPLHVGCRGVHRREKHARPSRGKDAAAT